MPQHQHRHLVGFTVALIGLVFVLSAVAADRDNAAFATLPESNEALLITSKIEDAIHAGDYRLAIEMIERLKALSTGLVAAPASRTFYPVGRQAMRLLEQLPAEGIALYRQLYDAEIQARFVQAATNSDIGQLRELFRGFPLCTIWPRIREELAAQLLDQGAFNEAVEVLRETRTGSEAESPERSALLAVALARSGAKQAAAEELAKLQRDPALTGQEPWRERLDRIRHWMELSANEEHGVTSNHAGPFLPRIDLGSAWAQEFIASDVISETELEDLAGAAENQRRLPLQEVVTINGDETLLIRQMGKLAAFDADTLRPIWEVREHETKQPPVSRGGYFAMPGMEAGGGLSIRNRALLGNPLRHALSAGFGLIYTIESLPPDSVDLNDYSRLPFQAYESPRRWNELVARDPAGGLEVWSTHDDPGHPLYDVTFQNVPLVTDRGLLVPYIRGEDLLLAVLDPATGSALQEIPLVGPPAEFPASGGRCLLVQDATTVYVCTGNGVIAALAREDQSWRWAATYPSDLAERLGRLWWQPAEGRADPNIDSPLLVDDLLIVAPVDSDEIIALNRFDGTEAWRLPRRDQPYMIGTIRLSMTDGSRSCLILGGRTVACYELSAPDLDRPIWRSAPLHITGRAACGEDRVYVPTRDGILVLDGKTGKVIFDQNTLRGAPVTMPEAPGETLQSAGIDRLMKDVEPTQNLRLGRAALYGATPVRLIKYPDPVRIRERWQELAGSASDEKSVLLGAWLEALERDYERALARLDALPQEETGTAASRDRLVTYLFLQMARQTAGGEEQLNWLRHAKKLTTSGAAAARMSAIIGAVLEREKSREAALEHYVGLLLTDESAMIADPLNPSRTCASWVYAARRIQALAGETKEGAWETLLKAGALDRANADRNLPRVRVALAGTSKQAWVEALLAFERMAPELKALYLKKNVPDFLPATLRRWFILERWDTHVSLGQLDRGEEDRAAYLQSSADATGEGDSAVWLKSYAPPSAAEQTDRASAIELAARKLRQFDGQPYSPPVTRQWKIEHAELLLDLGKPLGNIRPWILVTDLEQQRIELINAYKHQQPQRQTADRLEDEKGSWGGGDEGGRRFDTMGGPRTAWPAVIHQDLSAIPVNGGLVGLGLGPERYAGRRLWSYAVPEWEMIPSDFETRATVGPEGVYFTPRSDRVALVEWQDGRLRWQLDFPGVKIERLELAGDQLIVVSADRGVWLVNAMFGDEPRRVEQNETPVQVDVTGNTLVFWGLNSVRGITITDLNTVWEQPAETVADTWRLPEGPWIAYRCENSSTWRLLDTRTGGNAFDGMLGRFDKLTAAYVEGRRLYVAGMWSGSREEGELRHLTLRALDAEDGAELWTHEFETNARVNATQLAAHQDYIPFLLNGVGGSRIEGAAYPMLQWITKADGSLLEPMSIREDYRGMVDATCEMYLLATPTRIIVQIGGNVLAYGNSPLRQGP